jgi:hypothetical protein
LKTNNWDLKLKNPKYLNNDLKSLLEIMYRFGQYILNQFNTLVSNNLTITGRYSIRALSYKSS